MMTTRRTLLRNGGGLLPPPPPELREHGSAGGDAVAHLHTDERPAGERDEEVDPRAEPDHSQPSPLADAVADLAVSDDAAGDQASDLAHQHGAAGAANADRCLLIVEARLLRGGVEKPAGVVAHQLDASRHRIAVDVHVEHAHEDRDSLRRRLEVHGLLDLDYADDLAVRWGDHHSVSPRAGALWVAEEDDQPHRDHEQRSPEEPPPGAGAHRGPDADDSEPPADCDEHPALGCHPHRAVSSDVPVSRR